MKVPPIDTSFVHRRVVNGVNSDLQESHDKGVETLLRHSGQQIVTSRHFVELLKNNSGDDSNIVEIQQKSDGTLSHRMPIYEDQVVTSRLFEDQQSDK